MIEMPPCMDLAGGYDKGPLEEFNSPGKWIFDFVSHKKLMLSLVVTGLSVLEIWFCGC